MVVALDSRRAGEMDARKAVGTHQHQVQKRVPAGVVDGFGMGHARRDHQDFAGFQFDLLLREPEETSPLQLQEGFGVEVIVETFPVLPAAGEARGAAGAISLLESFQEKFNALPDDRSPSERSAASSRKSGKTPGC